MTEPINKGVLTLMLEEAKTVIADSEARIDAAETSLAVLKSQVAIQRSVTDALEKKLLDLEAK